MNAQYRNQKFFLTNSLRGSSLVQILIYTNLILFTLMVLHGTIKGLGMGAIMNLRQHYWLTGVDSTGRGF